jgi:hypothetical protein
MSSAAAEAGKKKQETSIEARKRLIMI